jgi:hypothetical protein
MSTYEVDPPATPARIETVARARKQWRRTGKVTAFRNDSDFFRDEAPEAAAR